MLADILSWALIIAIPGPDIVAIGTQSITRGHRAGFVTASGAALGVAIWSLLSLVGISATLLALPALKTILPVIGALVLAILGVLSLVGAWRSRDVRSQSGSGSRAEAMSQSNATGLLKSFRLGLITNLSNPKALVFFTSFFTPMMAKYDGFGEQGTMLAILLVVTLLIFFAMSVILRVATTIPGVKFKGIKYVPGIIFISIGVYYFVQIVHP